MAKRAAITYRSVRREAWRAIPAAERPTWAQFNASRPRRTSTTSAAPSRSTVACGCAASSIRPAPRAPCAGRRVWQLPSPSGARRWRRDGDVRHRSAALPARGVILGSRHRGGEGGAVVIRSILSHALLAWLSCMVLFIGVPAWFVFWRDVSGGAFWGLGVALSPAPMAVGAWVGWLAWPNRSAK